MARGNATENGRPNQRLRTRKDLLAAAGRLLKAGTSPTMDDVAREAMVSRATAYRYFPTVEALLVEAPLDSAAPDPAAVFAGDTSIDPLARIDKAEAALHAMTYANEAQLRLMLVASIQRAAERGAPADVPVRQNRRMPLIDAALAPMRGRLSAAAYRRLTTALAHLFGTESLIVCQDVLAIDERTARRAKSWAIRSLVTAALAEAGQAGET